MQKMMKGASSGKMPDLGALMRRAAGASAAPAAADRQDGVVRTRVRDRAANLLCRPWLSD